MKILKGISAVALLLVGIATPSFATSLTPGNSVVPGVISDSSATLVANTGAIPFNFGGDTGNVVERVVTNWAGNPFGAGDLAFIFEIQVTGGNVVNLTTQSYNIPGILVDVSQINGGIFGTPTTQAISASWTSNGQVIGFGFTPPNGLTAGNISYALVISTNQTLFMPGVFSLQDGQTQNFDGFVPTAATPEPGSLALLGTGLLGVAGVARRRFFRK